MPNNLCQIQDVARAEVVSNDLTYLEHQSFVWHRHSQSLTHVVVQHEPRIASTASVSMRCTRSLPSFHQWDMLFYQERYRSKGKTPPCSLSLRKPPRERYHWFACCHARNADSKTSWNCPSNNEEAYSQRSPDSDSSYGRGLQPARPNGWHA